MASKISDLKRETKQLTKQERELNKVIDSQGGELNNLRSKLSALNSVRSKIPNDSKQYKDATKRIQSLKSAARSLTMPTDWR